MTVAPFHAVSVLEGINQRAGQDITVHYARGIPELRRAARATPLRTAPQGGQVGVTVEQFGNAALEGKPESIHIAPYIDHGAPLDYIPVALGEFEPDPEAGPQSMRWTAYYTPKSAGEHDLFVQFGIGAVEYALVCVLRRETPSVARGCGHLSRVRRRIERSSRSRCDPEPA